MTDIYLIIDGQQAGPFQPAQVRQLLAEGKVTAETPAWHKELTGWSTLAPVMAEFPEPAAAPPPYAAPSPVAPAPTSLPPPTAPAAPPPAAQPLVSSSPSPIALAPLSLQPIASPSAPSPRRQEFPPAPPKQGTNGCLIASIVGGVVGLALLIGGTLLAVIAYGPIKNGILEANRSASTQKARGIEILMFEYAVDHNGAYPDGKTSTEVFQKLIDEKYADNPEIFYVNMPGKTKATGMNAKLTPENVCFDVTSGVTDTSPGALPTVFLTGYTITYQPRATATPDSGVTEPLSGLATAYKDGSAKFLKAGPDGTVPAFVPATFDPGDKTYRQLRP